MSYLKDRTGPENSEIADMIVGAATRLLPSDPKALYDKIVKLLDASSSDDATRWCNYGRDNEIANARTRAQREMIKTKGL